MGLFKKVRDEILENAYLKEQGKYTGVPVPFKRLADYIPVWDKGQSIGVLGSTGVGKSRFARSVFIYQTYKFYKETGYKLKVLYFPLEDNKEKVYKNVIAHYLYEEHGITISINEMDSKGDSALKPFVQEKIVEAEDYFEEFEKVVTFIDGINEPSKIYAECKKFALKLGEIEEYYVTIEGQKVKQFRYESDYHVFCLVDNMSNLDTENLDERRTMVQFAKDYVRAKLCNFFKWTVIQVMQADFQTERKQFNRDGEVIVAKLEPNLASIGDAKTIARSMHLILSLFDPNRHDLLQFPKPSKKHPDKCYDIGILKHRFRSLRVIKNNDGATDMRIGLLFNALAESFEELPAYGTPELAQIYAKLKGKPVYQKQKNVISYE